ncbi:helix-turn-helix domain-containing protein [Nocardia jejuensis]|uniref:helix-turn-helix domain-containing protein n=1 Tax=Nocardia jejuensis TaxID=328049 RepID=UPI00082DFE84|nr:AraC family transcriptional regulator [Nocardia jejuensis]
MLHPSPVVTAEGFERAVVTPESLRPWISEIGHIPTVREPIGPLAHVPQTAITLVLRTQESGRRDAFVLGSRTKAVYADADKPAGCTRLRLAPGAARPLLGLSAADLTDRAFRLREVPGPAADLADTLAELAPHEIVPFLESALPQRLTENATRLAHRRLLTAAVDAMATGSASLTTLAATLAVSERQLRALFTVGTGLSPKHYARILRLRRVLAAAGNTPWSDIAVATGYFDQSHLTSDFRSLMGVPPAGFVKGHLPVPTPCAPLSEFPG